MDYMPYQQQAQATQPTLGKPALGKVVWNLESQMKALGDVNLNMPSIHYPHMPQSHALSTLTQKGVTQWQNLRSQVRTSGSFVGSIVLAHDRYALTFTEYAPAALPTSKHPLLG